jgi:tetratricopeptide (TPR) repeat protein
VRARPAPSVIWIYAALFLGTLAVYARVARFDFVNFDDPDYVTANPHVRAGITAAGARWAFTSVEAANWFPLTRLSHMLDVQLFGLRSGWHHGSSVLIHALAALLLFAFLDRATGARWRSAVVAGLFAVHPLHVESVAWIAERKDVLSAFFWFLTLWAYVRYAERPDARRYGLVLASFCLGLMAKPMLVTLPLVLLLLDRWPLGRRPALREKLPLFALAAASAIATYLVQSGSGAVQPFPLGLRLENSLVSYAIYIGKLFWPSRLAVFYPYPASVPVWQAAAAGVAILGISVAVLRGYRAYPYLAVGWFWFLGTLVPVIGLVQVGAQARADRYMYIPMTGLAIALAWGAAELIRNRKALAVLGAAACAVSVPLTWAQTAYWANSRTLFQHAIEVTQGNSLAHHNLGLALSELPGRLPDAIAQYREALRIQPNAARAHTDLGNALAKLPGGLPEAMAEYQAALRTEPDSAIPHNDFGNALAATPGGLPQAIVEYQTALRLQPEYAEAHNNLGSALAKLGRWPEAAAQFQAALQIDPEYAAAHANLARALAELPGRLPDAIAEYQAEVRRDPNSAEAHNNLGGALSQMPGRLPEAMAEYQAAIRIDPDFADAHINLGGALADAGRLNEALAEYGVALRLKPDSAEAHFNLGVALARMEGRTAEAIGHFETALRIKPDYADAHNNLGVVLSAMPGRQREAIEHFEAAVRINPGSADAQYNLGTALANAPGRMAEAIVHFEAALRIRPDPELQALVNRLRTGGK